MQNEVFNMKDADFKEIVDDNELKESLTYLQDGLKIDLADLSIALIKQSTFFLESRNLMVHLIATRDRAKRKVEEFVGLRYIFHRDEMTMNKEKITEAQIKARVDIDPLIVAKHDELVLLNRAVGVAQALADAYSQRGWMLRELVSLHGGQYPQGKFGDEGGAEYDTLRKVHAEKRKEVLDRVGINSDSG